MKTRTLFKSFTVTLVNLPINKQHNTLKPCGHLLTIIIMELQHNVFFIFAVAIVCHHNALVLPKLI